MGLLSVMASNPQRSVCLVTYTTEYRTGGPRLARVAETLAAEKGHRGLGVLLRRVESKREFLEAIASVAESGDAIGELHFVGHAGMYGPMFRTMAHPEQMSPHEWRTLDIPFSPGAEAYFHACRTARWFAPFFARTFGVAAHGHHHYTTFSLRPDRFQWEGLGGGGSDPLYLIGCAGRKSHGLMGSVRKYAGLASAEPMKRYESRPVGLESTYDGLAPLYDEAFADIRVRTDEWRWLDERIPTDGQQTVLDIGCGNGALLDALSARYGRGVGLDSSSEMLTHARARCAHPHTTFFTVEGPRIPLEDDSVDIAISLLSFRYLDWDPLMAELRRVLRPGGRFLVVDMVTAPPTLKQLPRAVLDSLRAATRRRRRPAYARALSRLVADPRWGTMLHYNPIRAEHEYVWYLESRFPGRQVEVLNIGSHAKILAFDTGPIEAGVVEPQRFP